MSFRKLEIEITLKGTVLAMIYRLFPDGIPASVNEYAKSVNVAPSTFTRCAKWLLALLPGFLKKRRPGPATEPTTEPADNELSRKEAIEKLRDLRRWLKRQSTTPQNQCYDGPVKKRIVDVADEIHKAKVLTYKEIAAEIGMTDDRLRQIRREVAAAGGQAPAKKSTRPKSSPKRVALEIQLLIAQIEASADTRRPYGPTDIKRIIEIRYPDLLKRHHPGPRISEDTVAKYMGQSPKQVLAKMHPRGSYVYPEPFQVVALDTSYFKVFGVTFYLITVFDMGGRLNLLTRIFLREDTEAVVSVIEEFLFRYPGIEVVVIDRGSPYLNENVRALLESHGLFRVVSPPESPTMKAALERHFGTLKPCLRQAVDTTFSEDPSWPPEQMAKALEIAVYVFCQMYHLVQQEYIDGASPSERATAFDPVRAAARKVALFEQALNNEPSDDYAREFHRYFDLPWEEKETVGALRRFSTEALRKLLQQEKKNLGPPLPNTFGNPLGYLTARAREIQNDINSQIFGRIWQDLDEKQKKEAEAQELRQDDEAPEAHVDGILRTLITSVRNNHGVSMTIRFVRRLLSKLKEKMGSFFPHEVSRLIGLLPDLCADRDLQARVATILKDISKEILAERLS